MPNLPSNDEITRFDGISSKFFGLPGSFEKLLFDSKLIYSCIVYKYPIEI
jgi:hypothetical protein